MLTIRFARVGRKNRAQFRIVLQEHTAAPTGRHVAVLGSYDPHLKKSVIKTDEVKEWLGKGAQASDSVHNLFVREGIIKDEKRAVKVPKPEVKEESKEESTETESTEEKKEETQEKEEVKAEEKKEKSEEKEEK